jgi:hypothetical protein
MRMLDGYGFGRIAKPDILLPRSRPMWGFSGGLCSGSCRSFGSRTWPRRRRRSRGVWGAPPLWVRSGNRWKSFCGRSRGSLAEAITDRVLERASTFNSQGLHTGLGISGRRSNLRIRREPEDTSPPGYPTVDDEMSECRTTRNPTGQHVARISGKQWPLIPEPAKWTETAAVVPRGIVGPAII